LAPKVLYVTGERLFL